MMEKRHQNPSLPSSAGTDEVQFNKRVGGDDHLVPEELKHKTVCIIGLGYVGLPLAEAFSKHLKTIGFDIDGEKLEGLKETTTKMGWSSPQTQRG
jgi:UDP-N-acetyl-D-mannosaminuronate dehydrogenase